MAQAFYLLHMYARKITAGHQLSLGCHCCQPQAQEPRGDQLIFRIYKLQNTFDVESTGNLWLYPCQTKPNQIFMHSSSVMYAPAYTYIQTYLYVEYRNFCRRNKKLELQIALKNWLSYHLVYLPSIPRNRLNHFLFNKRRQICLFFSALREILLLFAHKIHNCKTGIETLINCLASLSLSQWVKQQTTENRLIN